jgi:hypothetical protein
MALILIFKNIANNEKRPDTKIHIREEVVKFEKLVYKNAIKPKSMGPLDFQAAPMTSRTVHLWPDTRIDKWNQSLQKLS